MFYIRSPRTILREYRAQSGLAVPQSWLTESLTGGQTMAGETVSVEGALAIADVFAAVNLIAEAIGSLPLKVYRDLRNATGGDEGIVEAPDHRAYRMLHDMPNPYTPAIRFWSTVSVHLLLWGNAYLEKFRDDTGLVAELRLVHPSRVTVWFNEATGAKRFRINRLSGEQVDRDDTQLLHVFGVSNDGIVGLSPIQQSREALGTAKARERWEGEAYGQSPYARYAMEHPREVKDPKRIRDSWRAIYSSGSKDRGGLAVLEEGATLKELSMPMQDMQFVESAQLSKTQIANIFKLPPTYIGGSTGDSLTYSTVESNKIWLATQTLAPVCVNIAKFLSRDFGLFPFQSWFCEFEMEGLLRGDSNARANYYEKALAGGWMTVNEVREKETMQPLAPEELPPKTTPVAANGNGGLPAADAAAIMGAVVKA